MTARITSSLWAAGVLVMAVGCGSSNAAPGGSAGTGGARAGSAGTSDTGGSGGAGGSGASDGGGGAAGNCVTPDPFRPQLGVGAYHGCALKNAGSIVCWGKPQAAYDYGQETPPPGHYTEVSAGAFDTCVLSNGLLSCWGDQPDMGAFPGKYVHVVAGFGGSLCVLDDCGRPTCWLVDGTPPKPFVQIAVGTSFACGLTLQGMLRCWGMNQHGKASPPAGQFVFVAAGDEHACAIREDHSIACWGAGRTASDCAQLECGQAAPPSGQYQFVTCGAAHSCAIRVDGTVACWGAGTVDNCPTTVDCGQSLPPAGIFTELSAGLTNTCGIRQDGHLVCWGSNTGGRSTPPANYP